MDVPADWAPKPQTSAQVAARGTARGASQVLDRGAHAVARGTAYFVSQVFDRGAQAVASLCGAGY